MADDVGLAQNEIDGAQKMTLVAATKPSARLQAHGLCHHCEQALPETGRLFCDADCVRDYEGENWARRMSSR